MGSEMCIRDRICRHRLRVAAHIKAIGDAPDGFEAWRADEIAEMLAPMPVEGSCFKFLASRSGTSSEGVAAGVGNVKVANAYASYLDADLAIIDKRRPRANEAEVMNLIGDVQGRTAILVDDMVDTAGTLCTAANALKERGALKVVSYCTHAVLSGKAFENIKNSQLDELVVTDTIPLSSEALAVGKIRQLTIADLLAESIRRVSNEESISALFDLS